MLSLKNQASKYFERKTDIVNGERVFKGTRIPVERILHLMLYENYTIKEIKGEFPKLSDELLGYTLWYAAISRK